MAEFFAAMGFFALMILGMSVGVIFAGKSLTGSCGGKGSNCDACDRPEEEKIACEKQREQKKAKKMNQPRDWDLKS